MPNTLKIVMAQLDLKTAAIERNTEKIIEAIKRSRDVLNADLIVFPEMAITSYPPEDLLQRNDIYPLIRKSLDDIAKACKSIAAVVGYPRKKGKYLYNSAAWLQDGEILGEYDKQELPNYGVFDEKRYFTAGDQPLVMKLKNTKVGVIICEDVWHKLPMEQSIKAGAELIVVPNASPYSYSKIKRRKRTCQRRAANNETPIVYVNYMCGQDDLLFDGNSMAINTKGEIRYQAPTFEEGLYEIEYDEESHDFISKPHEIQDKLSDIYRGLVLGVKDYVTKNGFKGVLIGLSGGIDSALTLAIASDALGHENVHAVMMPSDFTSQMSLEDAEAQAKTMGIQYDIIPIKSIYDVFEYELTPHFEGYEKNVTEENLQARIRGTILMALSNKTGKMVLSTGNKSEMAVGYATLYGDMAGGYCVLKDVYKTLVYKLAKHRNEIAEVIPERVITREPTAELAPNQKDEDSLPPYEVLDKIIKAFVDKEKCAEEIIEQGFDPEVVHHVIKLILNNEYKRQQSPPGPRITSQAFGRNRRYPITSGYLDQLK